MKAAEVTESVRNVVEKESAPPSVVYARGRTVVSYDDIDSQNVDEDNEKVQQNQTKLPGITTSSIIKSRARPSINNSRENPLPQRPRPTIYRKQRQTGPMSWQVNRRPPPSSHGPSITTHPQYNSSYPINSEPNLNNPAVAALAAAIVQAASDSTNGHVAHNNHQPTMAHHHPTYATSMPPFSTYPPYVHNATTLPAAPPSSVYPVYQDTSSQAPPYFQSYMLYPSAFDYRTSVQTPYDHQRQPSVYPNPTSMDQSSSTPQYYNNPYR
jgi:hypothetical protein